jgi:hypothetical protein
MKHLKTLGLAVLAAMALTALAAGSASATTLEVGGTAKNLSVEISSSLESETILVLKDTAGFTKNQCNSFSSSGSTESPYSASTVTVPKSEGTLTNCTRAVTTHSGGKILLTHIASSTNATIVSSEYKGTVGSAIGTLTCETGAGTIVGTLTGVASGNATVDVNGVINCGIIPSAKLEGTLTITSPEGLGATS